MSNLARLSAFVSFYCILTNLPYVNVTTQYQCATTQEESVDTQATMELMRCQDIQGDVSDANLKLSTFWTKY